MGLLSGSGVEAHLSNEKPQLDSIYKFKNDKKLQVYGISDDGVLVVEKNEIKLLWERNDNLVYGFGAFLIESTFFQHSSY